MSRKTTKKEFCPQRVNTSNSNIICSKQNTRIKLWTGCNMKITQRLECTEFEVRHKRSTIWRAGGWVAGNRRRREANKRLSWHSWRLKSLWEEWLGADWESPGTTAGTCSGIPEDVSIENRIKKFDEKWEANCMLYIPLSPSVEYTLHLTKILILI